MSSTPSLLQDLQQGVLTLTLNRATQRNALDVPTLAALTAALAQARENAEVRCVVLAASGVSFCSGADVKEWAQAEAEGRLETYGWTEAAHVLMARLHSFSKPTLAVIQGSAVGAGVDLALCCDLRLATRSAKFRPGYTAMAYSPDAGASWHLPRLIGQEQARRFLLLDEAWGAEKALATGLVGELCEDAEVLARTQALAQRLASGPSFAHAQTKTLLAQSATRTLAEQLEAERLAGLACGRTADAAEALAASAEKRAPKFTGA